MNDKPQMVAPQHYQEDPDEEGRVVDNVDIHALTQLNAAEINQQIMTARAYPRSVTGFRRQMREMVTYDQPTALSCLYALKRGSKVIEGPSVRFAEAALQSWGNARAGSRIVDIGEEFITSQGFFYDLERNMALAFEVMRRITDSSGNRYGDDMIGVTGNAASSIAFRNAILKGIPKIAWNEPYQDARMLSIGKGESISVKREGMLKAFQPFGIVKEQIFAVLGVKGLDDVSVDHMILMGGILNSIKEGDITPERAFAPENFAPGAGGVVTPPRPQRSEFERRGDKGKPSGKKTAAKDKKPPADKTKTEDVSTEKKDESKAASASTPPADDAATAAAREEEFAAWFDQQKENVPKQMKVGHVAELRNSVLPELANRPDKEREFIALCDARSREIMEGQKRQ